MKRTAPQWQDPCRRISKLLPRDAKIQTHIQRSRNLAEAGRWNFGWRRPNVAIEAMVDVLFADPNLDVGTCSTLLI